MGLRDWFDSQAEQVGCAIKAAVSDTAAPSTPFPKAGGTGGLIGAYGPYSDPLHSRDLRCEPNHNSIVTTCVSKISKAFASAPPVLERRVGDKWERVEHPIIDLLNVPNPHQNASQLWEATLSSEIAGGPGYRGGNGFWRIVMNRGRTQPAEIWFERMMTPVYSATDFIEKYWLRVDGQPYPVLAAANGLQRQRLDYAIHFRYELDRHNPRWGTTPLNAVMLQIAGDDRVAVLHNAIMENGAVIPLFVSPKDTDSGKNMTPEQFTEVLNMLRSKYRDRGAGNIAGSNLPVDVHKIAYTPDELAVKELVAYYEARVCAVLDVPLMVAGLQSGDDTKTYANYGEAIQDFWTRVIIPQQERHGAELEAQLFPLYGLDRREYRIAWDRSEIKALQEDADKLHQRVREDYKYGLPTLREATSLLNYEAPLEGGDERYKAPAANTPNMENPDSDAQNSSTKALLPGETIDEMLERMAAKIDSPEALKKMLDLSSEEYEALLDLAEEES